MEDRRSQEPDPRANRANVTGASDTQAVPPQDVHQDVHQDPALPASRDAGHSFPPERHRDAAPFSPPGPHQDPSAEDLRQTARDPKRQLSGTFSVMPWLGLTRELAGILTPIKPRAEFRKALYHSLVISARQQTAQRQLFLSAPLRTATPSEEHVSRQPARRAARGFPATSDLQPRNRGGTPRQTARNSVPLTADGESGRSADTNAAIPSDLATQRARSLYWPYLQPDQSGARWVLGAAALGSAVSLVGVVAYVWRHRHRRDSKIHRDLAA
jgi:hypothetical protein